jgi:phosphopantetheine adenylyltransferase
VSVLTPTIVSEETKRGQSEMNRLRNMLTAGPISILVTIALTTEFADTTLSALSENLPMG